MLKVKNTSLIKNQKGLATLESVVLLIVFAVMVAFSLGFFGVIHSGIKNSIAARSLAFETFRNRANLKYRRDTGGAFDQYSGAGFRFHETLQENVAGGDSPPMWATDRKIAFGRETDYDRSGGGANPVFVKTKYGICLNAGCSGGD